MRVWRILSITAAVAQFVTLQNTPFLYLGETVVYFIQYQLFATLILLMVGRQFYCPVFFFFFFLSLTSLFANSGTRGCYKSSK